MVKKIIENEKSIETKTKFVCKKYMESAEDGATTINQLTSNDKTLSSSATYKVGRAFVGTVRVLNPEQLFFTPENKIKIYDWRNGEKPFLVLHGETGTGKTSVFEAFSSQYDSIKIAPGIADSKQIKKFISKKSKKDKMVLVDESDNLNRAVRKQVINIIRGCLTYDKKTKVIFTTNESAEKLSKLWELQVEDKVDVHFTKPTFSEIIDFAKGFADAHNISNNGAIEQVARSYTSFRDITTKLADDLGHKFPKGTFKDEKAEAAYLTELLGDYGQAQKASEIRVAEGVDKELANKVANWLEGNFGTPPYLRIDRTSPIYNVLDPCDEDPDLDKGEDYKSPIIHPDEDGIKEIMNIIVTSQASNNPKTILIGSEYDLLKLSEDSSIN